jgi:hypothetical protein
MMEPSSLRPPESEVAVAATPDAPATPGIQPNGDQPESHDRRRVVEPARNALRRIRSGVTTASEATVDLVGHAVVGVERSWSERPGSRVRRVRRLGAVPLPFLYDVYPEARSARPVDVGLETIDVTDIAGTAVGGGAQRGGDFLPLKDFRGANWQTRWQRLRQAHDKLVMLPPIDVLRYGNAYWVVDGHNRVAVALYAGQVGIDANVVELVAPGARRQEPILPLAPTVLASQAVRTAGGGNSPSLVLGHEDDAPIDLPAVADDPDGAAAGAGDARVARVAFHPHVVDDVGGERGAVEPGDATDRSDGIE